MQHISCNTGSHAFLDMSTLPLWALRDLGYRAYITGNALMLVLQLHICIHLFIYSMSAQELFYCWILYLHMLMIVHTDKQL